MSRHYDIEEVRALSLTRGVCSACSEPWPKGANTCRCGATGRDALVVAPVIGELAETVEHLHAEVARINRLLVVQTSRGDGAEAAELRLTRERDVALAEIRSERRRGDELDRIARAVGLADYDGRDGACADAVERLVKQRGALHAAAREYIDAVGAKDAAGRYGSSEDLYAATERRADAGIALREMLDQVAPTATEAP